MSTKHLPEWVGPFDGWLYRMYYQEDITDYGRLRGWSVCEDGPIKVYWTEGCGWSLVFDKGTFWIRFRRTASPTQLVRRFNAACKRLGRMGE